MLGAWAVNKVVKPAGVLREAVVWLSLSVHFESYRLSVP